MMEKVQLILQLLHPYTFIPTSTVIREMRVTLLSGKLLILGLKEGLVKCAIIEIVHSRTNIQ